MGAVEASRSAYVRLSMLLEQQANAVAFKDVVATLALVVLLLIPIAFVMKKPAAGQAPPAAH